MLLVDAAETLCREEGALLVGGHLNAGIEVIAGRAWNLTDMGIDGRPDLADRQQTVELIGLFVDGDRESVAAGVVAASAEALEALSVERLRR